MFTHFYSKVTSKKWIPKYVGKYLGVKYLFKMDLGQNYLLELKVKIKNSDRISVYKSLKYFFLF